MRKLRSGAPALLAFVAACSSTQARPRIELELSQDARVQTQEGPPQEKKAGESVEIEKLPALVEAPGYMSLLVAAAPETGSQKLKVDLKPMSGWGGRSFDAKVAEAVVDIVSTVTEVQILLASRKADQALEKVQQLENRYPQIRWLNFLKSSCLLATGNRENAKAVLENALREYPDDPVGKRLYKALSDPEDKVRTAGEHHG